MASALPTRRLQMPIVRRLALLVTTFAQLAGAEVVDKVCTQPTDCLTPSIEKGRVVFKGSRSGIKLDLGAAARKDARIPATEAAIMSKRLPNGWHVIVSSALVADGIVPSTNIRIFDAAGRQRSQVLDMYYSLVECKTGHYFGPGSEFLVVETAGERAFLSRTAIWRLSAKAGEKLRLVGDYQGYLGEAASRGAQTGRSLWVNTYDGINAETKQWVERFLRWSPATRRLQMAPAKRPTKPVRDGSPAGPSRIQSKQSAVANSAR